MYYGGKFFSLLGDDALMIISTTSINQAYNIALAAVTAGVSSIDWGDGSAVTPVDFIGTTYQTYSHVYTAIGTYNAKIVKKRNIKALRKIAPDGLVSMSIDGMPLTYLTLTGIGTIITGSITGLVLNYLYLSAMGSVIIGTIPPSSRLTRLYLISSGPFSIPFSQLVFGPLLTDVYYSQATGLTAAELDYLLIAAAATTWAAPKTFWAAGNNAVHTSASNAAIATLTGLGVSLTLN